MVYPGVDYPLRGTALTAQAVARQRPSAAQGPRVRVGIAFAATPEGLAAVHTAFDELFGRAETGGEPVGMADQLAFRTAAAEIAANIVEHACRNQPDARVTLVLRRHPGAIEAAFEDPGIPYAVPDRRWESETPFPGAAGGIPQGGRGMLLVQASVDVVEYERVDGVNRWRLVRSAAP
jgi:serine/threonine-protein kinase RsbW